MTAPTNSSDSLRATQQERIPLYRNTAVIKWVSQVVVLIGVIGVFWFFGNEAASNLNKRGIKFDFDFININQGFDIGFGIDRNPNTGGRALWVGMVNTLRLAISAIIVATILGVVVGVARLSKNWIAARTAGVFIETLRNIPLLVQIFIWLAIFQQLGPLEIDGFVGEGEDPLTATGPFDGWFFTSAKGIAVPRVFISDGFYQWAIFLLIGFAIAKFMRNRLVAKREATGESTYAAIIPVLIFAVVAVVGWFAHPVFGFLGGIFQAFSDAWARIPQIAMQLLFAGVFLAAAVWWIKRFLDSRRTPAGLAKLIDDDYFRIIFAGLGGIAGVALVFWLWPGLPSWVINSGSDFFQVAADKFGNDENGLERLGVPVDAAKPSVINAGGGNIKIWGYGPQGLNLPIEFSAVFFALALYTAAFIAEIVRGGILAVPKGQIEAAQAIGLSKTQALRFVTLPQAFRVILPPLGNQYLNLTKNTSLAIAALFTDVYVVGNTVINQSGRVLSVFIIWMVFYLTLSLIISVVVNFFNVRLAIVER